MKDIVEKIKQKSNLIIATSIILVSLLVIIPIIIISKYNVASADDYSYSINTAHAWNETNNIFEVLKESGKEIADRYYSWQGTFSAILLFSLQPSIWGVQWYSISTIILLIAIIFSNVFLVKAIAKNIFNYSKNILIIIIALVPTIVAIEYVPYSRESLFWWNGASYYTLFYSFMLVFVGVVIKLTKSKSRKNNIIYTILAVLLSIIIGGGNYPVALVSIIITFLGTIYLFIVKNNKKWNLLTITMVGIVSLIISLVAPGNTIRQEALDNSLGPIGSIIRALYEGIYYILEWTNISVVLIFVFLVPFIYRIIKNTRFKFRYPLIFTLLTFGIFSSQFVPPLCAMNGTGPGRLIDIIYYSFYWLIGLNVMYYIGWIKKRFGDIKIIEYFSSNILIYSFIILVLFTASLYVTKEYRELTSFISYSSLKSGEAQEYYKQMMERYKIYEDDNIKDVVVKEITAKPEQIYGLDITEDKENWINKAVTSYFNKNTVVLEKKE